jgi:signal peptide peptidase SppA
MRLEAIRSFVSSQLWAIAPGYLEAMIEVLELRSSGTYLSDEEIVRRIAAADHGALHSADPQRRLVTGPATVAVLPLYGLIAQKASMVNQASGPRGTSTEAFGQQLDAVMNDPAISAVVIDVNSPGGAINGVPELTRKLRDYRGTKPIEATVTGLGASGAYYVASAADKINVTPSGEAGSIGVYTVHNDLTGMLGNAGVKQTVIRAGKFKAEGHPAEPLSDDARAAIQGRVDEAYDLFVKDVAKNRGVSVDDVRSGYGEGRVVSAKRAVELGMADGVETIDDTIARLARARPRATTEGSARRTDQERRKLNLADRDIAL